jgi:hypothetical protein
VRQESGRPAGLSFLAEEALLFLGGFAGCLFDGGGLLLPFTALAFMSTLGLASLGAFSRPAVNEMPTGIPNWQFTTADARIKLKRLYPSTEEQWSTSPNR